jgi:hypothetical protein
MPGPQQHRSHRDLQAIQAALGQEARHGDATAFHQDARPSPRGQCIQQIRQVEPVRTPTHGELHHVTRQMRVGRGVIGPAINHRGRAIRQHAKVPVQPGVGINHHARRMAPRDPPHR